MANLNIMYDLIAITFDKDLDNESMAIINSNLDFLVINLAEVGYVTIERTHSFINQFYYRYKRGNSCKVRFKHKDITDLYNIDEYLDYIEVTEGQELKRMYHLALERLETTNINLNDKFKIGKHYGL